MICIINCKEHLIQKYLEALYYFLSSNIFCIRIFGHNILKELFFSVTKMILQKNKLLLFDVEIILLKKISRMLFIGTQKFKIDAMPLLFLIYNLD